MHGDRPSPGCPALPPTPAAGRSLIIRTATETCGCHHFAAFFQVGFMHPGTTVSTALVFEQLEAAQGLTSVNTGGVQLGDLAQQLGQQVANGTLQGNQLGNAIRSQACWNP